MADTPRIYVASLSDYNAGRLHGAWIDATQEPDEIHADVQKMLAAGTPGAEEWAIHDYEGFGSWRLSEWESFDRVSSVAQTIEEHGEPFLAWLGVIDDPTDYADMSEAFQEAYRGEWESAEDYAYEQCKELGWGNVPALVEVSKGWGQSEPLNVFEELSAVIDWESIARDMFRHGSCSFVGGYVFEDVNA